MTWMKRMRTVGLFFAVVSAAAAAGTRPAQSGAHIGDTYEITRIRQSSSQSNGASSGTTYDRDTLTERTVAIRPDGLEVTFDLPRDATADDRRQTWQFPSRVFEPREGALQLLNAAELEKRLDAWLKWGLVPRTACGHWVFTWNAFKIECDPQSVLKTIEVFDPRLTDLRQGALYRDRYALQPAPLTMRSGGSDGSTFIASLTINPAVVQRERAESDVVVGEISRKPVTLEAALINRAKETVSGTIEVTITVGTDGTVRRLMKVSKLETKKADGNVETETTTETLERHLIPPKNS